MSQMKTGYEWEERETRRGGCRERETGQSDALVTTSKAIKTNKFFHIHTHVCDRVSMCACVVCVAVNSEIDIIFHKAEKWFQL